MTDQSKDPMMQPCRRGCGELVHLENDGFHVCRTSNQSAILREAAEALRGSEYEQIPARP